MATCRSCGAEIVWAETVRGKRQPIDPLPVEKGKIVLREREGKAPLAIVVDVDPLPGMSEPKHLAHHATCPDAEQWRRRADQQNR